MKTKIIINNLWKEGIKMSEENQNNENVEKHSILKTGTVPSSISILVRYALILLLLKANWDITTVTAKNENINFKSSDLSL